MAKIGYARVSSTGQSLDVQLDKLNSIDCDKVYQEKISGKSDNRPELAECLRYLREGDTLAVTRLDRLGRSTLHLCQIAKDLENRGIALLVTDQAIDTSTPTGKLLFHMLASIAEFETELRKERQVDGIAKAKESGVAFGPKAKLTPDQLTELRKKRADGVLIKDLMAEYKLSKASVYRLLE